MPQPVANKGKVRNLTKGCLVAVRVPTQCSNLMRRKSRKGAKMRMKRKENQMMINMWLRTILMSETLGKCWTTIKLKSSVFISGPSNYKRKKVINQAISRVVSTLNPH